MSAPSPEAFTEPDRTTDLEPRPSDQRYPAEMAGAAVRFLVMAPIGIRLVVRHRVSGGYTDALGYLRTRDKQRCTIDTRRGVVTVALADVVAAKQVPEPPARR